MLAVLPSMISRARSWLGQDDSIVDVDRMCSDISAQEDVGIRIEKEPLSAVRLLGLSKASRPVKIYQTSSPAHADYIEQVSRHPVLGRYFAEVFYKQREYLVVEWVPGATLRAPAVARKPQVLEEIVNLQTTLHGHTLAVETGAFDYLSYLQDRLWRYLGPFARNQGIRRMMEICEEYTFSDIARRVSHADITPANLVVQRGTGRLKVVDNELLTQSCYYLIDLFNTHASLGGSQDLANCYVNLYCKLGGDPTLLLEHRSFFLAVWGLRLVGAKLQAGHVAEAFQLVERIDSGYLEEHPLLRAAEEIGK
jgi:hypothetical protein